SLIGGLITLAFAIYREDPVFIAGQSIGAIVYIRNLMLISRSNQANQPIGPSSPRT
ncbi:MAG: lipid-A-disaccharide synthase N-terminal domain-containing protein, partial [Nitrospirae bacterium]|nr:lipid-A-disaccharide synthase N-terminal domain-containing protein [Nitrospirota bacterium]